MLAPLLLAQITLVSFPETRFTVTDNATSIPVTVRLAPFAVSATEVTQRDFEALTGANPSTHRDPALPVHNVTWWEAIRFANLLSLRDNLTPAYDLSTGALRLEASGYRLPTDAEWTHAAGSPEPSAAHLGPDQTKDTRPLLDWVKATRPRPPSALTPDARGLYGMYGNVWEWVHDYFDPTGAIAFADNPAGPLDGLARIVRGGSFASTTSRWARGYRSSQDPNRRSPFTGFRLARTLAPASRETYPNSWFDPYQDVPAAFRNQTGPLTRLTAPPAELRSRWLAVLGEPAIARPLPEARLIRRETTSTYTGELRELRVEPDYWEKIYLLLPHTPAARPLPVVIVPYYDVDTPAGASLGGRLYTPLGTRSFAHLAVQQGFAAVAIRWFGESYAEHYVEAVAQLKLRHPRLTGLGKWVWDAQRLADYLETLPALDARRIGMIGHSLGAKMTLYATAFDPRIRAAVASEPGIGLSFSNYEDFWYLGEDKARLPAGADHHELLALIAPRPFLLIGGDSADNDKSWYYINAAAHLFTPPARLAYLNHRKGHSPTAESVWRAMEWLRRFLLE